MDRDLASSSLPHCGASGPRRAGPQPVYQSNKYFCLALGLAARRLHPHSEAGPRTDEAPVETLAVRTQVPIASALASEPKSPPHSPQSYVVC